MAIFPPALRDLDLKVENYLAGRLTVRMPDVTSKHGVVGPVDFMGDPIIAQLENIGGIGIIRVNGALFRGVGWLDAYFGAYDYDWLATFLAQALSDRAIEAILVDFDSPGGSHVGMEENAAAMAEAARQKPLLAFSSGMLCSAAYALAVPSETITSTPSAQIGCLGSKLIVRDSSVAFAQMGLRVEAYTAGANGEELPLKAMMEPGKPITEPERAFYRATTQHAGRWVKAVSTHRPQAKGVSFEGGWVFGSQAVTDGLVDGNQPSLEAFVATLLAS